MRPINLLPPEAFAKAESRKQTAKVALLGLLYLVLLAVGFIWWQGRVQTARDEVDAAVAANASLETQVAQLSEVQGIVDEYDTNVALLTTSLADDLSWGRLLNDLGRLIPDRVWLESLAAASGASVDGGGIGSLTVSGFAFDYPDVSAWLRSLDSDRFPGVTGTWVQSITDTAIGAANIVTFSSTTSLTRAATSQRLVERIPVVGQ